MLPTGKSRFRKYRQAFFLFRSYLQFVSPDFGLILQGFIAHLFVVSTTIIKPLLLMILVDNALLGTDVTLFYLIIIAFFLLFIYANLATFVRYYLFGLVRGTILFRTQKKLLSKVQKLPISYLDQSKVGYLMSRISDDASTCSGVITETLISTLIDAVWIISTSTVLILLNWKLAMIVITLFPLTVLNYSYFAPKIRLASRDRMEKVANKKAVLVEIISSIRWTKQYNSQFIQLRKFGKSALSEIRSYMQLFTAQMGAGQLFSLFVTVLQAFVLWFGGLDVLSGSMTIGQLLAFYMTMERLFYPASNFANLSISLQSVYVALTRIHEVLNEKEEKAFSSCILTKDNHCNIELHNISFSYNEQEPFTLENISMKISHGSKVALVGRSGSGKSTLLHLILRFYETNQGRILIEGKDIRKIDLHSLRKVVGLVTQDTFLFNCTIRENLLFANRHASEKELQRSLELAGIWNFISSLPKQLGTIVGERGTLLSGGQRQRIALARTFIQNPQILLLDEPASALDPETETKIWTGIETLMKGRTCLIVTHRVSAITNSDIIFVLKNGRLVGAGNHDILMRDCETYQRLYEQQFKTSNDGE